jgi:hypothetical protein
MQVIGSNIWPAGQALVVQTQRQVAGSMMWLGGQSMAGQGH